MKSNCDKEQRKHVKPLNHDNIKTEQAEENIRSVWANGKAVASLKIRHEPDIIIFFISWENNTSTVYFSVSSFFAFLRGHNI